MRKILLVLLIVFLALVLAVCGINVYMRISMSHLGFLTPSDVDKLLTMVHEVQKNAEAEGCSFPIDTSSLGDQQREQQMLRVDSLLVLYYAEFNRSASSIEDLDALGRLNRDLQGNVNDLKNHCVISVNSDGKTVASCGVGKPAISAFPEILRNAPSTERFYEIGSNEVLFIPAPKCRALPSTK
jgi:hypothetical protein